MSANETQVGGKHYKTKYEHWDLVIKIPMDYLEGCASKYVARWRKKDGMEDLKKAMHYIDKLIEVWDTGLRRFHYLNGTDINKEVALFAKANDLTWREAEVIRMLSLGYPKVAKYNLNVLMGIEKPPEWSKIDEPNHPGTPEDGGHHAQFLGEE